MTHRVSPAEKTWPLLGVPLRERRAVLSLDPCSHPCSLFVMSCRFWFLVVPLVIGWLSDAICLDEEGVRF